MYQEKPLLHKRQKAYQKGQLRTIALDVTTKCNMNCDHCYADTFAAAEQLDLAYFKPVFDEAYALGVHHYVLQGGEAIVDESRLEAIIDMIYPDETYINVVSNGWMMQKECIAWLKALKVDKIAFSLDSGIEAEHDQRRKKGSFKRVLEAIDRVQEEGMLTSISTVVTHQSLYGDGFKKVLEIASAKKIRLDVQIAMPVGKWDGRKDILITPEDARYIRKLRDESPVLPNGQQLINRDVFNYGGNDHCPAGGGFMGITADGHVLPCNFCQFSLGNISHKTLGRMRSDLIQNQWFNGTIPRCLLGEDAEFFDTYVRPYVNEKKPLDAYELFQL